ncbi:sterol desaturase family protein [Sorangium sp. So ce854]|uniref:sterol desaturase family protein n=1 Tax=Sorangium sp. So ce854 TaxID=3133322 RepID=UPI003F620A61
MTRAAGRRPRGLDRPSWSARAAPPIAAFGLFLLLERLRPLRRRTEPARTRVLQNLALAAAGTVVNLALNELLVVPVARRAVERRRGVLQRRALPRGVETALGVAWLDYTLYLWHLLTHRAPWFWRMHAIHHADRDLDVSTGVGFHPLELAISIGARAGFVAAAGVSPRAFDLWQSAILISSVFHHANVRLPLPLERLLGVVVVTPRLHGIHHSEVEAHRRANLSSGLTLWDWLHGTLRGDVPQARITIGLPDVRRAERFLRLLALPFSGR